MWRRLQTYSINKIAIDATKDKVLRWKLKIFYYSPFSGNTWDEYIFIMVAKVLKNQEKTTGNGVKVILLNRRIVSSSI